MTSSGLDQDYASDTYPRNNKSSNYCRAVSERVGSYDGSID